MKLQDVLASCGQDRRNRLLSRDVPTRRRAIRVNNSPDECSPCQAESAAESAQEGRVRCWTAVEEDSSRSVAVFGMRLPNPYEVADLEDEVHNIEQKLDD